MRRALVVALLIAVTACPACFDERTRFPSGVILCSTPGRLCPKGLQCGAADLCWAAGDGPAADAPIAVCQDDELRCFGKQQHRCAGGVFALITTCGNACLGGYCVECTPNTRRCNGARPQRCGETGAWSDLGTCAAATPQCEDGECLPPCSPVGARRCTRDGLGVQECDLAGQFRTVSMCTNLCVPGSGAVQAACGGECRPGSAQCGADQTTESCDPTGHWTTGERCAGVCQGAACSGECRPGASRCAGGNLQQSCGSDARWAAATVCTFVCDPAPGNCGGVCSPDARRCNGSKAELCGAGGTWSLDAECFPQQCTDGQCGPCASGATQCNAGMPQRCTAGVWGDSQATPCPFLCDQAQGCVGECVPGTTTCDAKVKKACGTDGRYRSETCGFVCIAGQCAGSCEPGTHRCNGESSQTCSAMGEWSGDQSCAYGCDPAAGQCKACVPESVDATCVDDGCGPKSNNCGQPVQCPSCTGTGTTCGGGGQPGFCGCTAEATSVTCGNGSRCLPASNNCGQLVSCADSCIPPYTCGGGDLAGVCGCTRVSEAVACEGKNCGTVTDGCGGRLSCWPEAQTSCSGTGQTCGGGGTTNVCGCTPAPQCGPRECGQVANGCGGMAGCGPLAGACPSGRMCDGTGHCVANCVSRTQCDVGFECGTQEAGCGLPVLDCGACTPPDLCDEANHKCRCQPATGCTGGQQCGTQPDGCDGMLSCGHCDTGQVCTPTGLCRCKTNAEACGSQQCGTAYAGEGCAPASCGTCADTPERVCVNKMCVCRLASEACKVNDTQCGSFTWGSCQYDCGKCDTGECLDNKCRCLTDGGPDLCGI